MDWNKLDWNKLDWCRLDQSRLDWNWRIQGMLCEKNLSFLQDKRFKRGWCIMVDLQPLRKCRRWKDGCTKPGIHMKYLWRQWTLTQKCTMHVMIHLYITRMSGDMGALSRIVKEHLCLRIYLKGIVAPTHHQMSLGTFLHCLFVCCMTCPELHWWWCSNLERLFWLSENGQTVLMSSGAWFLVT